MGRFRKFLPYTAFGMVVAWLAIAGVPPSSGFFSKDEIIRSVPRPRLRALDRRARRRGVHRVLHDPADLLTFYGNERSGRRRPVRLRGAVPARSTTADGDVELKRPTRPRRTVSYGDRCRPRPRARRTSRRGSWCSRSSRSPSSPPAAASSTCRSRTRVARRVARTVVRGVPEAQPTRSCRAWRSKWCRWCSRRIGIGLAYTLYQSGLAASDREPLDEKLGPVAQSSATRTTTTRRLEARRRPGRGFAASASTGGRPQDHRRRGQRHRRGS